MQMWPCGSAAGADITDHLALCDARAWRDAIGDARHMGIGCGIVAVMANLYIAPVRAQPSGFHDYPASRSNNRGAGAGSKINALMHTVIATDGMFAHAVG